MRLATDGEGEKERVGRGVEGESLARMELLIMVGALFQQCDLAPAADLPDVAPIVGFTLTPQRYRLRIRFL